MYKLAESNLDRIFEKCQFNNQQEYEQLKDRTLLVEGIPEGTRFGLHPDRLKQYDTEIEDMLQQLPKPFFSEKDGVF